MRLPVAVAAVGAAAAYRRLHPEDDLADEVAPDRADWGRLCSF
jgi:hypothetical protein